MKLDVLLWLIRMWALITGSACIPCVVLWKVFGRYPARPYRTMQRYYLIAGISHFLLLALAAIVPTEARINRVIPMSPYLVVYYIWMVTVLMHAGAAWSVMFSMTGMSDTVKKEATT